jgi:hypothetical protein
MWKTWLHNSKSIVEDIEEFTGNTQENTQIETPPDTKSLDNLPSKITVVETIYHQNLTEEPFAIESNYDRSVKTKEQPYQRHCIVGEEWQQLDTGWIGNHPSLLYIHNREGEFPHRIPTPEEVEQSNKKVLLLSFDKTTEHSWRILPKESHRGLPSTIGGLFIRSCSGITKYTLCLLPE